MYKIKQKTFLNVGNEFPAVYYSKDEKYLKIDSFLSKYFF